MTDAAGPYKNKRTMWTTGPDSDRIIRQYEREQLDVHYRTLPFWKTPPENRGFSLLAAYDALFLALPLFAGSAEMAWMHKSIEDGLSQCLRWILVEGNDAGIIPTAATEFFGHAAQFLMFGSTYQSLFDIHVSYGQGLVRGEVDQARRIVRFSYPAHDRSWINAAGISENWDRGLDARPKALRAAARVNAHRIRSLARSACVVQDGRVVLSDSLALGDGDLAQFSEIEAGACWIPIPSESDLEGFSLGELSRFWGVLRRWAYLTLARFQLDHHGRSDPPDYFPTQVADRDVFASAVTRYSGLDSATTGRIIERLTLAPDNPKGDIFLTPLIHSQGRLAWSPRVIIASQYQRNMLKVMARLPAIDMFQSK